MSHDEPRGLIVSEDIAAVREKTSIEDIVAEHVTLKVGGVGSMKGLCPFHDERTPSFHVRPHLGLWHCFGCNEGGDVISFVQKIDALDFAEAVEHLALKAGIQLRYETPSGARRTAHNPARRARLIAANRAAEEYFRSQITTPEAITARQFLADKGFTRSDATRFGVGYAPKGWNTLRAHMHTLGFTDEELEAVGLVAKGPKGTYDRFRGRVIWPIRDQTGTTIGFGARKLDDQDTGPKYLNTPETTLYRKNQVLYGLDLAKRDIARNKRVIIVEGYTDVMAAHLAGHTTAVATCGTAFGADHAHLVRRIMGDVRARANTFGAAGEVIFTFDGDQAGQKAAMRAFEEDQRFAAQTFVAVARDAMDPCDLRQHHGDQAITDLIDSRIPLFEFVIRKAIDVHDLSTAEGRIAATRAAGTVLNALEDQSLREAYAAQVAHWVQLDKALVERTVSTVRAHTSEHTTTPTTAASSHLDRERAVLALIIQHPALARAAGADRLTGESFTDPDLRHIFEHLVAQGALNAQPGAIASLSQELSEAHQGIVSALAVVELDRDEEVPLKDAAPGLVARLASARTPDEIRMRMSQVPPGSAQYQELHAELVRARRSAKDARTRANV